MASNGAAKQKRNKPCENCRAHRRKCYVAQDMMQCDRCHRMELPCVFKFTIKPDISRKAVPVSKRNRMLDQVHFLEDDVAAMEEQLRSLNVALQLQQQQQLLLQQQQQQHHGQRGIIDGSDNDSDTDDSVLRHPKRQRRRHQQQEYNDADQWQLTLSRSADGLQFQTNIKSVADIAQFLQRSMPYFSLSTPEPARSPTYYVDRRLQRLTVTNKMLFVEQLLRSIFGGKMDDDTKTMPGSASASSHHGAWMQQQQQHSPLSTSSTLAPSYMSMSIPHTSIKLHFFNSYFRCFGQINPVFVQPYYQPLLNSRPDSMLTTAMAAFIGYSQCQHVDVEGMSLMSRRVMAESFRQEARQLLEESMFEQEPDLETMGTLVFLGQCSLILLRNSEARLSISMAWQIALQLRDKYVRILDAHGAGEVVDEACLAEAESWRRIYYMIRYLEISLHMIHDERANISPALLHDSVGFPALLPSEEHNPDTCNSIRLYQQVVRLNECHIFTKVDETGYRLMAGTVDTVRCTDVENLENQMIAFWRSMPPEYRLSDGPMEYLDEDRVLQCCRNYHVLYLNKLYYSTWLSLEARLMHAPEHTNLTGASLNRIDSERALLIVSICTDALARIFQELHRALPCVVELHLVLVASDAMKMLSNSRNHEISARATRNLQATLGVLKGFMDLMSPSEHLGFHAFSDAGSDHTAVQGVLTPYSDTSQSTLQTASDDDVDDDYKHHHQLPPCDYHSHNHHNHNHNHNHNRHPSCASSSSISSLHSNSGAYFNELKRALEVYFSGHGYA